MTKAMTKFKWRVLAVACLSPVVNSSQCAFQSLQLLGVWHILRLTHQFQLSWTLAPLDSCTDENVWSAIDSIDVKFDVLGLWGGGSVGHRWLTSFPPASCLSSHHVFWISVNSKFLFAILYVLDISLSWKCRKPTCSCFFGILQS